MATYYARDGTPVHTAFALPVNTRGEVDRYTMQGRQRLYTKARLDELDRRAAARKAPAHREKTMSEQALDMVKAEFAAFLEDNCKLLADIEHFRVYDETLQLYWHAVAQHGLVLSSRDLYNACLLISQICHRHRGVAHPLLTKHKIPL